MQSRAVCAWFLTVALVVGFALHGVQAAQLSAMTPATAPQISMPDGCGGCDDGGNAPAACLISCAAGLIPIPPTVTEPQVVRGPLAYTLADIEGPSLHEAPDPFPPKNPVLS